MWLMGVGTMLITAGLYAASQQLAPVPDVVGIISTFETAGPQPSSHFGAGWQVSTDRLAGGTSSAAMQIVRPGAAGSRGALEISGTIAPGASYAWAGALFSPGWTPMAPDDLSHFKEIVFRARGDGREYLLMIFAAGLGSGPAVRPFTAGTEWTEFVMPFRSFQDMDGSGIRGILFAADSTPGAFRFAIDDVRLR